MNSNAKDSLMKAFVVVQPGAGKGDNQGAVRESLDRHFGAAGIAFEIYQAHRDGDLRKTLRASLHEGFNLVVVAGGDGTVSSVLDGLHGSSVPLGIIPTGTGNLIAREFGIPSEVDDAVALIAGTPRSMRIDAMRISGRVYVLNAGVGVSAAVIAGTTRTNKRRFGHMAYFATGFRIFKFIPRRLDVTVDGTTRRYRAIEVAISNCGILARTLYPRGPDIRSNDGRVDVWILSMRTFWDYVRYFLGMAFGWSDKAEFLTAEKGVTITSRVPLPAQADGDIIGTTPLVVEVLPGALTVLVPEQPIVV